ncbi:MAG: diacylglycerol kinase family protein [Oscillospiraceae bacterium]|nr:diacylglycerol kinase family protein [Oscillospiraceae bacterium]MDD7293613.1 diacylglycerol kinase family protein [Clostridiaceae bacterium]
MSHYKNLFKSFYYAFRGIFNAIKTERNLRVHLTCLVYMFSILGLTDWFVLSRTDWAVLAVASALVIGAELVNTAIENAVDLETKEYNEYAKRAKDAASGAVLVCAIGAVAAGLFILLQPQAFSLMADYFSSKPLMFVLFALSIVPATLFIFFGFGKSKDKK